MIEIEQWPAGPMSGANLVASAIKALADRIPSTWTITEQTADHAHTRYDASLILRSPDGKKLEILIEAKVSIEARDVPLLKSNSDALAGTRNDIIGMVATRYLTKSTQDLLSAAELSFVDATGNLRLRADFPSLFLSDRGADNDPWRKPGRPRGTLKGEPAAKVVRALLDQPGPWKITELVTASASSTGSVYRVLEFLEAEGLTRRENGGQVVLPSWPALLRRWSDDYQLLQTNSISRWIAPRGIDAFLNEIRQGTFSDYLLTGSVAAATWAPYAPIRSAMAYCPDPNRAAEAWGLKPTDTGANVILVKPAYNVLADRAIERTDGLRIAAPTQVAVDLMTGPGRAPSEAEELMEWMKSNESLWR